MPWSLLGLGPLYNPCLTQYNPNNRRGILEAESVMISGEVFSACGMLCLRVSTASAKGSPCCLNPEALSRKPLSTGLKIYYSRA